MNYRPDVDGLRAIAILFVLFFHGGLQFFPSGFIGVDIFFVISGFLITGIIYEGLQTNNFSFGKFYSRRLWRMQPVFICLLVVTACLTAIYFLPDDFMLFAKSARKASIFNSNTLFARITDDYFAPNNYHLPLLHTWSLSIEWQCYMILPIVIYCGYRIWGVKHLNNIVLLSSLLFFLLALYFSFYAPEKTYYQVSSRIFEFLIGSSIALNHNRFAMNKFILNGISLIALIGLFYLARKKDISYGFPNAYALLVCLATALLIAVGGHGKKNFINALLALKPVVFVGLISYSLYIWHWPVFVIFNYLGLPETNRLKLVAFIIIFIISYFSWQFIEKPTRRLNKIKLGYSLLLLFIIPVIITHLCARNINRHEGYPQRFGQVALVFKALKQFDNPLRSQCLQKEDIAISNECMLGAKRQDSRTGFMIGDSFSNHSWEMMDLFAKKANIAILAHSTAGCLTLPGIGQYDYVKHALYSECLAETKRYYQTIKANHYNYVILGQNWSGYLQMQIVNHMNDAKTEDLTKQRIQKALDEALQIIVASGAKPIIIKAIAYNPAANLHDCFFYAIKRRQKNRLDQCNFTLDKKNFAWFDNLFLEMAKKYPQLIIVDPVKVQCPQGFCQAVINGAPVFRDALHITDYASYQLGRLYLKIDKNPFTI